MSNDYLNPFDSSKNSKFNSTPQNSFGENCGASYRKISKELEEDRVEICGKISKKSTISFGKNIQKLTTDSAQALSGKLKNAFLEMRKFFKRSEKSLSPDEIRADLKNFLQTNKIKSIKEFNKKQIGKILQKVNKDNVLFIKKLCADKDLDACEIEKIIDNLKDYNLPLAKKMLFNKKFSSNGILCVLEKTTEQNIEAKVKMFEFLQKNSKDLTDCSYILMSVDEDNVDSKIKMYNFLKGKVSDYSIDVSGILYGTDKQNIEAKIEAFKFFNEKNIFSEDNVLLVASYVDKFDLKTKELAQMMIDTLFIDDGYFAQEVFMGGEISEIKLDMFDFLRKFGNFKNEQIMQILRHIDKNNIAMAKMLCEENEVSQKGIAQLLSISNSENIDKILKMVNNPKIKALLAEESLVSKNNYLAMMKLKENDILNLDKLFAQVEAHRANALKNPQLYINGEVESAQEAIDEVNKFFDKNKISLAKMSSTLDKEAINNLLRMRFEDAEAYIKKFLTFDKENTKLLEELANSCNLDGKPLMPTQKIELMDLLLGYKLNNLDTSKMYAMIEKGRVDVGELNLDLLVSLLKRCDLSDKEIANIPKEKIMSWDINYIHLLANEIRTDTTFAFSDVLRIANLEDFKTYILDTANKYGQVNAKTQEKFNKYGLNYKAWLNSSVLGDIQFKIKDKNQEALAQITEHLIEDIEALRQTPAKSFIDKQFAQYLVGDKFVIPEDCATNKAKLAEFTKNILKQLDSVFKRAQGNLDNPTKATTAQNTLTIKDHLNQRLADIANITDSKVSKTYDLTIKMWDRIPQKDIFQGNYSTCCIGMSGGNGSAMPNYLMNTTFNMIEIVDNKTNKPIGNALCYFVVDKFGKPAFVLDNIEIKNSQRPSDKVGIELRSAIAEYAKKVAKEVTGSDNTKIYMGGSYNDVPNEGLKSAKKVLELLGETECDEIYMDAYGGWVGRQEYKRMLELFKLEG